MSALDLLGLLLVAGVVVAGLSLVVHGLRVGIAPMPTSPEVRAKLLSLVPPQTTGQVLELGSGWGGLAFALADRCPDAEVVGYESSRLPFLVASLRLRLFPRRNLRFRREDFLGAPLSGDPLVVCYLSTGLMAQLGPKAQRELGPKARILAVTFALRGWTPAEVHFADDLFRSPLYLYRVASSAPTTR